MSLRRNTALLAFVLAAACAKDVKPEASPSFVDYAVFDPSASAIPLPNDLALASAAGLPDGAQKDLLLAFAAQGGFPNDIEVPITIDFERKPVGPGASSAPTLDPATVRPIGHAGGPTVALFKLTPGGPVPAAYDTAAVTQTPTPSGSRTTLRLRAPQKDPANRDFSRNWEPGVRYAVVVRGGASGVKTIDGFQIHAMPAMYLLLAGKDLSKPENQGLLPDPSAGAQLEQIRTNYLPVFAMTEAFFPATEIANVQTFAVAPAAGTVVRVDQTAGVVPLPFDLLRTDADGTIILNQGFGPAAPGLDTLDGFSTTAMMLAPTSAPVDASTVTAANVFLFKLPVTGASALVKDVAGALTAVPPVPAEAVYVTQPPQMQQACTINGAAGFCSAAIGLQPAVPAPTGTPLGTLNLPPLDEDTEYAVVVTNGVKDAAGAPLARSTLAKIILDVAHPVSANGSSQLAGIDNAAAAMLEQMRAKLATIYPVLPGGKTKADVAMAYTFKTQSITGVSLQLAALPYSLEQGAAAAVFSPVTGTVQPLDVTATYGIPAGAVASVDSFYTLLTPSVDAIDPTTGALRPDLATRAPTLVKPLPAVVAVPLAANVPSCGFPPPNDTLRCAKLVVYQHGLGGGHLQLIGIANALAAKGFVVAAVDLPLHGDRAPCSVPTVATDCNAGSTCDLIPGGAGQGDANPPGVCSTGNAVTASLSTAASGRYFISANFFRTRDAFRQNLIDQAALALSIARPPAAAWPFQPATNDLAAALGAKGIVVDPSEVYLESLSLGSIAGTQVLATSSRFKRGALTVGGATAVDVFLNSPTFKPQVDALFLNSLGFDRNLPQNAAQYLQTLNVLKWIIDPGDPLNFAKHLRTSPLPDLLSPTPALQTAKDVWGFVAVGDVVVTNPYNYELYSNAAVPWTNYTKAGGAAPHAMLHSEPLVQAHAADWLFNLTGPTAAGGTFDLP